MAKLGTRALKKRRKSFCPRGGHRLCALRDRAPNGPGRGAWEVRVFQSDDNAFALPGRHIGIYTDSSASPKVPMPWRRSSATKSPTCRPPRQCPGKHANGHPGGARGAFRGKRHGESRWGDDLLAALGLGAQVGILCPFLASRKAKRTSWACALWPTQAAAAEPSPLGSHGQPTGERTAPARATLHPPGVHHAPRCPAPGLTGSRARYAQAQPRGEAPSVGCSGGLKLSNA